MDRDGSQKRMVGREAMVPRYSLAGVGKRGARAVSDGAHIKEGMSHANCEILVRPVPRPLSERLRDRAVVCPC